MIEFVKFPSNFGMRAASPFALKLEAYLRLAGLEYKTSTITDPRKAPKGKVPFIKDKGKTIGDSSLCITYLKDTYGDTLGANFAPEQHAIGHGLKTMLEERTYWVLVHTRWIDMRYQQITLDAWFGAVPRLMRGFVTKQVVKGIKRDMYGHGIGRHTPEEIFAFGLKDIGAVEAVLGDKPYLLGGTPSEYDATVYGLFANIMAPEFPSPMSEMIAGSKSLTSYLDRIQAKVFG